MNIQKYKLQIEKQASLGGMATKGVAMAAKRLKTFGAMPTMKRVATGAAAGAALGGTKGAVSGQDGNKVESAVKGAFSGAVTGGLMGNALNNANVAKVGNKVSGIGDKVFDRAVNSTAGSAKVNNAIGNAGMTMSNYGNKIQSYFGGN